MKTCPDTHSCMELDGRGGCSVAKVRPFRCVSPVEWKRNHDGKVFHHIMWQQTIKGPFYQLVADDGEVVEVEKGWRLYNKRFTSTSCPNYSLGLLCTEEPQ